MCKSIIVKLHSNCLSINLFEFNRLTDKIKGLILTVVVFKELSINHHLINICRSILKSAARLLTTWRTVMSIVETWFWLSFWLYIFFKVSLKEVLLNFVILHSLDLQIRVINKKLALVSIDIQIESLRMDVTLSHCNIDSIPCSLVNCSTGDLAD
jgi:hypothetical protein